MLVDKAVRKSDGSGSKGFWLGIVVSLFLHVGLAGFCWKITEHERQKRQKPTAIMISKWVVRGSGSPKKLLPQKRKAQIPAVQKKRQIVPNKELAAKQKKKISVSRPKLHAKARRLKQKKAMQNAFASLKKMATSHDTAANKNMDTPGAAFGISEGMQSAQMVHELYDCLKSNYTIEGLSGINLRGREVKLLIFVLIDGTLDRVSVERSSGVDLFDRSVINAAGRCGKINPPPQSLAMRARRDGFEVTFQP